MSLTKNCLETGENKECLETGENKSLQKQDKMKMSRTRRNYR